jgi:hypothetical protein
LATVYGDLQGGVVFNLTTMPIGRMMKWLRWLVSKPMLPMFRCVNGVETGILRHQGKRCLIGSCR